MIMQIDKEENKRRNGNQTAQAMSMRPRTQNIGGVQGLSRTISQATAGAGRQTGNLDLMRQTNADWQEEAKKQSDRNRKEFSIDFVTMNYSGGSYI